MDDKTKYNFLANKNVLYWTANNGPDNSFVAHREDGPAIIWSSGINEWYFSGIRHRVTGPAITDQFGTKRWFINGKEFILKEEWFNALTSEQKENYMWNLHN